MNSDSIRVEDGELGERVHGLNFKMLSVQPFSMLAVLGNEKFRCSRAGVINSFPVELKCRRKQCMRHAYLKEYVEDRKLRASLELMKWAVLFKTKELEAIPFAAIFMRLADRTLFHSSSVWSQFISDLKVPPEVLKQFPDDAVIFTQDLSSKYEIEAYLGAAKALFEKNFLGINEPDKQNLLGNSFAGHPDVLNRLEEIFAVKRAEFFQVANRIRNHSYHVNAELKDHGVVALLKRVGDELAVTIPNVYEDRQGNAVDLAEVFISTHQSIEALVCDVRNTLLEFFFQQDGPPSHGSYQGVQSQYGTMMVGLGPKGFEFSDFHETGERSP